MCFSLLQTAAVGYVSPCVWGNASVSNLNNTPKAFVNFSPGLTTLGTPVGNLRTLKGFITRIPNAFSVHVAFCTCVPGLSLRFNPGLKLANAFGVVSVDYQQVKGLCSC